MRARAALGDRAATAALFARAAHTYWTDVFPLVGRELSRWRKLACEIPSPMLREQALQALAKRGNMEGAAAFATFVPRERRGAVVRATVAFQSAYNHLDTISEQSGEIGPARARALHEALLTAVERPRFPARSDGNGSVATDRGRTLSPEQGKDRYLGALVQVCQQALSQLPSYDLVAPAAHRAAERVVSFQAFHGHERASIERWGRAQTPPGEDLRWWETAASGGSSLGVHVMIAAAAEQEITPTHIAELEQAYFPWIGALHSMLDQLIDVDEDARTGQPNLFECYQSAAQAAERMALLAERALACARNLEPRHRHELIVAAMASFYLSAPKSHTDDVAIVTRAVLDVFGGLARPALATFKLRQAVERAYKARRQRLRESGTAPSLRVAQTLG